MKLYIYDHCPYCTKARMIFGYTNTSFELETFLNDDEEGPTKLIGKKMVPILVKDNSEALPESMDIIKEINYIADKPYLAEAVDHEKLILWLQESRAYLYQLAMPRWVQSDLDEFKTQSSIDYFTSKKEEYIGPFKKHLENTESLLEIAHKHLNELESFISEISSTRESMNHINLYASLRCLTIVKEIKFPEKVLSFMKDQEEKSKVYFHKSV